jgi:hypothetical protein
MKAQEMAGPVRIVGVTSPLHSLIQVCAARGKGRTLNALKRWCVFHPLKPSGKAGRLS